MKYAAYDKQNTEIKIGNILSQIDVGLLSENTEFARKHLESPQFPGICQSKRI